MGKLPFQIGSFVFMLALTYLILVHVDWFFILVCLTLLVVASLSLADVLYDFFVIRKH